MKLSEAIEVLSKTYKSLDAVAIGLPVDAKEVSDALAKAVKGSQEEVVLNVLAKYNPLSKEIKTKENIKNDSTDKVE